MRFIGLKSLVVVAAVVALNPLTSFADESASKIDDVFKTACVKAWMERSDKSSDKVGFKNFGEKYCDCAAGKSLENDKAIEKAAQICLSQVLLHDTMDNIESDQGLSKLSDELVKTGCGDELTMLYPDIDADGKKSFGEYCACASPKLLEINKNRDSLTDKEWYEKINGVAADCSGKVAPDKGTVAAKK